MKRGKMALAILFSVIGMSSSSAATIKFPGRMHEALSPDGSTAIINTDHDEEPNHVLSIENKRHFKRRTLFSYGRYVDVAWSPDSKFFFVNDYDGSDVARCILVDRIHINKYDTRVLLQKEMDDITARYKGSSWLVTCSSWKKADKVEVSIKVSGNGTDEVVTKWFLFDARNGAFTATR
jgi:hypothetical protein